MSAHPASTVPSKLTAEWTLSPVASYPRLRALFWDDDVLYASRGYSLLRMRTNSLSPEWQYVAKYDPAWWRNLSSQSRLASRLFRDGFHALAKLSSGHLLAAVPGAIVGLSPDKTQFQTCYKIQRGTRPLHIAVTPNDCAYWGEYFDNSQRDEVHIYSSTDCGRTWNIAHTFAKKTIRHVHNIVYDRWQNCLWILTGDNGSECRILRASLDFRDVETILSGNQQTRAVAGIPAEDGFYFSSDTPLEQNFVYRIDRAGSLSMLGKLSSSSIYGCQAGHAMFFSTMVEPSAVNLERASCVYGSLDHANWHRLLAWKKDRWPMRLFQYGNAMLPDGRNTTDFLAVSTIAVEHGDVETSMWRVVVA